MPKQPDVEKQKDNRKVEDVLKDEILADARRRAERVLKRAGRDGERVARRELRKAEDLRKHHIEQAGARIERDKVVFASGLVLEERRRRLATQGQLIDEVFAQALERLRGREGFDYRAVVIRLAVEAVQAMQGDEFVLRLGEADLASMKNDLPAEVARTVKGPDGREVRLRVADDPAPIAGGVIVARADGCAEYDNSLAARLKRLSSDVRFEVADVLFGDDATAADGKEGKS